MNRTEYAKGFTNGRLFERRAITDFIAEHKAQGVELHVEDIEAELVARHKEDQEMNMLEVQA